MGPCVGPHDATPFTVGPSGRTSVALTLPACGSTFVVLNPAFVEPHPRLPQRETVALAPLSGWTLTFQADRGAPATPVVVHDLRSWSEFSDPGVRYFSGTATYTATVVAPPVPAGSAVGIHFKDVEAIARVRINGKDAGTVWAHPHSLRVEDYLRPGEK